MITAQEARTASEENHKTRLKEQEEKAQEYADQEDSIRRAWQIGLYNTLEGLILKAVSGGYDHCNHTLKSMRGERNQIEQRESDLNIVLKEISSLGYKIGVSHLEVSDNIVESYITIRW